MTNAPSKRLALSSYLGTIDGADWLNRLLERPAAPRALAVPVFHAPGLPSGLAVAGLACLTWESGCASARTSLCAMHRRAERLPALRRRVVEIVRQCNAGMWTYDEAVRELFYAAGEAGAVHVQIQQFGDCHVGQRHRSRG